MPITNATYTSPDWTGYAYPLSLAPLPIWMSRGLVALCTFSLLSAVACTALLSYITYLFVVGGARYRAAVRKNQYVILIYSVLIADLQLAVGFLVSIKWVNDNEMYAPSSACIAQAWLTNVGDLASGLFVLAIAAHTFLAVVFGRKLEFNTFCSIVIGLWVVSVMVTAVPVILHPNDIFVVGGNWCSISPRYDILRLYFHYVWIFLAEFLVFFLYAVTFIVLRHRMGGIVSHLSNAKNSSSGSDNFSNPSVIASKRTRTERKMSLAAIYMILYPFAYVIVTLPLAAGRIAALAGNKPSLNFLLIGGCFMTSAGWIDCILYAFTRRAFLTTSIPKTEGRTSQSRHSRKGDNIELSPSVKGPMCESREIHSQAGSADRILRDIEDLEIVSDRGGVKVETTWEVMTKYMDNEHGVEKPRHKANVSTRI